jgi:hypothetical protein
MQQTITIRSKPFNPFLIGLILFMAIISTLYYLIGSVGTSFSSLSAQLSKEIAVNASQELMQKAIAYAAEKISEELDIDLENYDLSVEQYMEIVEVAEKKFGGCHQYRLYAASPRVYSCFTCSSTSKVTLNSGQTYKIGQTCGTQKTRYGSELPEPGLVYVREFRGNIFQVLVAEYVKLLLFQHSKERKLILETNNLSDSEMLLPPGNKIAR